MSIALDFFCLAVQFTMLLAAVLSVSTVVGVHRWPISDRAVHMDFTFGSFQTILPIPLQWLMPCRLSWYYIPHVLAHFIGELLLLVCCCWIFGQGKNIHLLCCVLLVMRYRIHLNRCVWSSQFIYIMSLCLDMTHCNSITGWFFFLSIWLVLYVLPLGISVPLTLLAQRL